jgi:5'-3' exonuclease
MPDYTKQRKSKLIQVCPKCGRKGRKRQGPTASDGQRHWMYVHVDNMTTVLGIKFNHITDHCTVAEPATVKA